MSLYILSDTCTTIQNDSFISRAFYRVTDR